MTCSSTDAAASTELPWSEREFKPCVEHAALAVPDVGRRTTVVEGDA
jgi:hypothetical protein